MASEPVVLKDADGREITYKEMSALEQFRMFRAIGAEQSSNQPYAFMAQAAYCVTHIDGKPLPRPTSERELDAAVARLGDNGLTVVQTHMLLDLQRRNAAAKAALEAGSEAADPLDQSAS